MPADNLLAIIPFYKNQRQLDQCVAALARQTRPVKPWIHDNSEHNLGFTATVNRGFREALRAGIPTRSRSIRTSTFSPMPCKT